MHKAKPEGEAPFWELRGRFQVLGVGISRCRAEIVSEIISRKSSMGTITQGDPSSGERGKERARGRNGEEEAWPKDAGITHHWLRIDKRWISEILKLPGVTHMIPWFLGPIKVVSAIVLQLRNISPH